MYSDSDDRSPQICPQSSRARCGQLLSFSMIDPNNKLFGEQEEDKTRTQSSGARPVSGQLFFFDRTPTAIVWRKTSIYILAAIIHPVTRGAADGKCHVYEQSKTISWYALPSKLLNQ